MANADLTWIEYHDTHTGWPPSVCVVFVSSIFLTDFLFLTVDILIAA